MQNIHLSGGGYFDSKKLIPSISLNDRDWKIFIVSNIFQTKDNSCTQIPTGAFIPKKNLRIGKVPRITVTSINNGIDSFCYTEDKNKREFKNFISVSFLGDAFYQKCVATLDMKVHALIPKNFELNQHIALFIIVALSNNIKNSSYGNQLSSKDLHSRKILLPINAKNEPDYEFMENYIKEREFMKMQEYLDYCNCIMESY